MIRIEGFGVLNPKSAEKIKNFEFANSSDLNEVALRKEPPHLDLHCLPSSL